MQSIARLARVAVLRGAGAGRALGNRGEPSVPQCRNYLRLRPSSGAPASRVPVSPLTAGRLDGAGVASVAPLMFFLTDSRIVSPWATSPAAISPSPSAPLRTLMLAPAS